MKFKKNEKLSKSLVPSECVPPENYRELIEKQRNDKFVNIKPVQTVDPGQEEIKNKIYNNLLKEVYTFDPSDNPLVKKNAKKYSFH